MGALRHASLICILMIAMLSVALLAAGSKTIDVSEPLDGPVQYGVHSRVGFLTQLPVLIFAYTCNMNVPIFYGSLRFNYTSMQSFLESGRPERTQTLELKCIDFIGLY